jgi:predicted metalloprotease with PDZ domain
MGASGYTRKFILFVIVFLPLSLRGENPRLAGPMALTVDATEISRQLLHAQLSLPVNSGPLTLAYPQWIPGEHAPTGPIDSLVGLKLSVDGQPLAWRRDLVELYLIHCEIPAGVSRLDISLDYVIPADAEGFSEGRSSTALLGLINWNQVLLYPTGFNTDDIVVEAGLRLPDGWQFGTALTVAERTPAVRFQPVSLTTLVDSPVVTGKFYRNIKLAESTPTNEMDIVADSSGALELPEEKIAQYRRLVTEAAALFGATHYLHYHFLVALAETIYHDGIEHHESSLNTVTEKAFTDKDLLATESDLLPHEFVHSWNGKYRRPASLTTPDFQKPMLDDMLWVYEGLTEYLGSCLLTARSGLRNGELSREWLAEEAAELEHRSGRTWRSLQDTADFASRLYDTPHEWADRRREVDFYPEGVLLWLEADTIIRQRTNSGKSLDDFCHLFHGGKSGAPSVKTYTFEEVTDDLNQVCPFDWRSFWLQHLNSLSPRAPLSGIEAGGWKLIYTDQPNEVVKNRDKREKQLDQRYSIGLILKEDGTIVDVLAGTAADAAKLAPAMKIVAVNSRTYTPEKLEDAIRASAQSRGVDLLVNSSDYYETLHLDYTQGLRYPHLERDSAKPDLLSEILKPHAAIAK